MGKNIGKLGFPVHYFGNVGSMVFCWSGTAFHVHSCCYAQCLCVFQEMEVCTKKICNGVSIRLVFAGINCL